MTPQEHNWLEGVASGFLGDARVAVTNLADFSSNILTGEPLAELIRDYNCTEDDACRFRIGLDGDVVVIFPAA